MNLDDFVRKYDGKFLEVAGSANAKNQCVDLANGYLREVLGLKIIEWTNAKDFPLRVNPAEFDYIKNTPLGVPKKGDLVVWGGRWGHIAIFLSGDVNWFTSFDENWPTGSVCHKVDHSYTNVIGWLRPRKEEPMEDSPIDKNLQTDANNWRELMKKLMVTGLSVDEVVKTYKKVTDLQTDANNWQAIRKTYKVESVEALTKKIDGGQTSAPCEELLIEKEEECVKKIDDLKKQNKIKVDLLKKHLVDIDVLGIWEYVGYRIAKWWKKLLESIRGGEESEETTIK